MNPRTADKHTAAQREPIEAECRCARSREQNREAKSKREQFGQRRN
jgi:hypothetical protein